MHITPTRRAILLALAAAVFVRPRGERTLPLPPEGLSRGDHLAG